VAILDGRARGVLLATVSQAKPLVLIPLSKSGSRGNGTMKYTLINAEDYALVKDYKWQAHWNWTNNSFYARTTLRLQGQRPKHLRLHRMLFGNELDGSLQIDHRNHVTLDNRRKNLRTATPAESGAPACVHAAKAPIATLSHVPITSHIRVSLANSWPSRSLCCAL